MPTKTEVNAMRKDELVELGLRMFEDEGNLREILEDMTLADLKKYIKDNDPEDVTEEMTHEPPPEAPLLRNRLDLGSW